MQKQKQKNKTNSTEVMAEIIIGVKTLALIPGVLPFHPKIILCNPCNPN